MGLLAICGIGLGGPQLALDPAVGDVVVRQRFLELGLEDVVVESDEWIIMKGVCSILQASFILNDCSDSLLFTRMCMKTTSVFIKT